MNRQEAITILAGLYRIPVENGADKFASEINKAIDMAIEALQDDWIPVSERLPEKDEIVLATVWNDVVIAWRNLYGGWESAEDMYGKGDVTAWRPLPTPYKESDEE